jgi:hypothetical protein
LLRMSLGPIGSCRSPICRAGRPVSGRRRRSCGLKRSGLQPSGRRLLLAPMAGRLMSAAVLPVIISTLVDADCAADSSPCRDTGPRTAARSNVEDHISTIVAGPTFRSKSRHKRLHPCIAEKVTGCPQSFHTVCL